MSINEGDGTMKVRVVYIIAFKTNAENLMEETNRVFEGLKAKYLNRLFVFVIPLWVPVDSPKFSTLQKHGNIGDKNPEPRWQEFLSKLRGNDLVDYVAHLNGYVGVGIYFIFHGGISGAEVNPLALSALTIEISKTYQRNQLRKVVFMVCNFARSVGGGRSLVKKYCDALLRGTPESHHQYLPKLAAFVGGISADNGGKKLHYNNTEKKVYVYNANNYEEKELAVWSDPEVYTATGGPPALLPGFDPPDDPLGLSALGL